MSDNEPLDLGPIEKRLAAATPGPWAMGTWSGRCLLKHVHGGRTDCVYTYTLRQGENDIDIVLPDKEPYFLLSNWDESDRMLDKPDIEFIANALTDIAAMATEIKRLRAEVARLERSQAKFAGRWQMQPFPDEEKE